MKNSLIRISHQEINLDLSYFLHSGSERTILLLHGLGCAKNDYLGAVEHDAIKTFSIVGLDFPGCGQSPYPHNAHFGIDDLVEITRLVLEQLNLKKVVLAGHSMGGLVGLLLAEKYPEKFSAFINIEGNLAGSDCFFSRKVAGIERAVFIKTTFQKYIHRVKINKNTGLQEHAKILQKYASAAAMRDVCPSLVSYSEQGGLLKRFLDLKIPIQFIYGSQNRELPYLPVLKDAHCPINEIENSGHFPFYDNPQEFYKVIVDFINLID
jgi:pimeloyl-ACP methyl ester carboxylesterase